MGKRLLVTISISLACVAELFAYTCPPNMPALNNIPFPFQATPIPVVNKGDPLIQVKDQIYSLPKLQGKMMCIYTSSIYGTREVGLLTDSFEYAPDSPSDWTETKDIFTVYGCDPTTDSCSFHTV